MCCTVVSNSVIPWTAACPALLSMEFCRQGYWSGLPFPGGWSQPRDWTWVSFIAGRVFTIWDTREDYSLSNWLHVLFGSTIICNFVSSICSYRWSRVWVLVRAIIVTVECASGLAHGLPRTLFVTIRHTPVWYRKTMKPLKVGEDDVKPRKWPGLS